MKKNHLLASYSGAAAKASTGNYFAFYNGRQPDTALDRNTSDNGNFQSPAIPQAN
jgi:hypothetical protein